MKKNPAPLLLLTAALLLAAAGARAAGTSGASFLRVGWGARPAAMGEAFTAAADDVDAVYWNPAGLNYVKRLQQTFGHNSWLEGTNLEHAAFALRRSTASVIGAGVAYLNTGDIERGNKYGYTEGYYSAADMSVLLSYARRLKKFHAGATLKVVQERIESSEAKAFAADAGAIYEFSPKLRLGATLRNLGTGLTLTKEAAPLPMGLRAGAALQFSKNLLLTSDASLPFDDSLSLHFGAEYIYPSPIKGARLALRGGFKTASMAYLGATSALTLGFGAEAGAVGLDYALSPYGDLGLTHRLSLKIKFDALSSKQEAPEIVIQKGKRTIRRGAAEVYAETLQWFAAKAASEKLSKTERSAILQRIIDKFSALGVDVSQAKQLLGAGQ
ncbi:MAG: PorV/PorQ family protein [Elusimicrobiales bacterium]|nr:PorV/PorQ family protein [Elusimicrobiales bacterium]